MCSICIPRPSSPSFGPFTRVPSPVSPLRLGFQVEDDMTPEHGEETGAARYEDSDTEIRQAPTLVRDLNENTQKVCHPPPPVQALHSAFHSRKGGGGCGRGQGPVAHVYRSATRQRSPTFWGSVPNI